MEAATEKLIMPPVQTLAEVFAPRFVGVPPSDATANLVVLEDGSLRCYGGSPIENSAECDRFLESKDHGLTWTDQKTPEGTGPLWGLIAVGRSPVSGDYFGLNPRRVAGGEWFENELVLLRSKAGPDGPYTTQAIGGSEIAALAHPDGPQSQVFDMPNCSNQSPFCGGVRAPLFIRGGKRALVCASISRCVMRGVLSRIPAVWLSDDDGYVWKLRVLEPVGPHPVSWPDRGSANQDGATEPTVVELTDGRLWMLIRTATEYHYEAFSHDGGETWTKPRQSVFRASFTMPTLHRLNDGRILLIWCSTLKMAEDHRKLTDKERRQKSSSTHFFSNRDVVHAAISSDDGVTWAGFRELYINPLRNASDWAKGQGGTSLGIDKSVHQSQAINLPHGKVLVATGQHPACRRLLVFDPDWLLEAERHDDFSDGLEAWSTFQYVDGVKGHCALDRKPGAELVEHPDDAERCVLRVRHLRDDSLVSDIQGAVWNFPAARAGEFTTRIRVEPGCKGGLISLMDCWVNPSDALAHRLAMYNLTFVEDGRCGYFKLIPGKWHTLRFVWAGLNSEVCRFELNGEFAGELVPIRQSTVGISYVLFQSVADEFDAAGFLIEGVCAKGATG